ncbi:MAG TPA: glycosyltransferase family 4 protein [Steroidobacteraceae bacterium]|nr:glycosyltransferase family 4 protein [Steroidobacteraceae bacterium]
MTDCITRPRKILITADAVGGVWTYVMELCAGLGASDVEIVLATMGPEPTRSQRQAVECMAHVHLECSDFRLEWMPHPWDDVELAGEWLLDLAEVYRPDLVHLNGYVHAALPWTMPVVVVAHSCIWSWWRAVHGSDPPQEWDRYRAALTRGLLSADAIVAPSEAMLRLLETYIHAVPVDAAPEARSFGDVVIHNGMDLTPLGCEGERAPLVFAAGRLWDEAKNIRTLDRAARELAWPVYVAGEPIAPLGQEIELTHARSIGPLAATEMQQWLARASIFASPALYEPFGLAVLEAAVQGCALVLGDIPSLREVWGDAALYVPPRDADRLAGTLSSLIDNPQQLQTYATRAQARACRYSRSAMVHGYEDLYAALLLRRRSFVAERTHPRRMQQ